MQPKQLVHSVRLWSQSRTGIIISRAILFVVIVASMASAGWKLLSNSQISVAQFSWPFAFVIGLAVIHRIVNAYGWGMVLGSMGFPINRTAATKVWLWAESRRWLPGGIWGYASRATMAGQLGVGPTAAVASMMLEMLMVIFAALVIVVPGFVVYRAEFWKFLAGLNRETVFYSGIAVAGLVPLAWIMRSKIAKKFANLQNRIHALRGMGLDWKCCYQSAVFFVGMNLLNGLISCALAKTIPSASAAPVLAILTAASCAWLVGLFGFIVFSPGGLLVREAWFAAMLIPWMPYTDALLIAVLARIAQLAAEGITIGVLTCERITPVASQPCQQVADLNPQ